MLSSALPAALTLCSTMSERSSSGRGRSSSFSAPDRPIRRPILRRASWAQVGVDPSGHPTSASAPTGPSMPPPPLLRPGVSVDISGFAGDVHVADSRHLVVHADNSSSEYVSKVITVGEGPHASKSRMTQVIRRTLEVALPRVSSCPACGSALYGDKNGPVSTVMSQGGYFY